MGWPQRRPCRACRMSVIQVIYDFATQHVYQAQNPTSGGNASPWWRPAAMATGELAPGSDVDLLFVRPFKPDRNGALSVIEFILYMLWDLGLKVRHATRSMAE